MRAPASGLLGIGVTVGTSLGLDCFFVQFHVSQLQSDRRRDAHHGQDASAADQSRSVPVRHGRLRVLGLETAPSGCMSSLGQDSASGLVARAIGRPMSGCVSGRMSGLLRHPTRIDPSESTACLRNVRFVGFL